MKVAFSPALLVGVSSGVFGIQHTCAAAFRQLKPQRSWRICQLGPSSVPYSPWHLMELAVNTKYPLIAPRPGLLQPLSCLVWHFSKSLTWLPMAWRDSSSEKNQWTGISWVQRFFLNLKILLFPIIISWWDKSVPLGSRRDAIFTKRN